MGRGARRDDPEDDLAARWLAGLVLGVLAAALSLVLVLLGGALELLLNAASGLWRPKRRTVSRGGILVTGASRGLGREAALALAEAGHVVLAGVRKMEDGDALVDHAHKGRGKVVPVLLDVTDDDSVAEALVDVQQRCEEEGVELVGLLNNAGVQHGPDLVAFADLDAVQATLDVNVLGLIKVTKAFLPALAASHGRVVNVSSVMSRLVLPGADAYTASKHAVEAVTRSLRLSLAGKGVAVVSVNPGFFMTDMVKDSSAAFEEWLDEHRAMHGHELPAVFSGAYARMHSLVTGAASGPAAWRRDVVHAFTAERPKARYTPGGMLYVPTALVMAVFKYVPDEALDEALLVWLGWIARRS